MGCEACDVSLLFPRHRRTWDECSFSPYPHPPFLPASPAKAIFDYFEDDLVRRGYLAAHPRWDCESDEGWKEYPEAISKDLESKLEGVYSIHHQRVLAPPRPSPRSPRAHAHHQSATVRRRKSRSRRPTRSKARCKSRRSRSWRSTCELASLTLQESICPHLCER